VDTFHFGHATTKSNGYLIQLDNMWMIQHLQYLNLSINLLQITLVQLGFIDNFDGNLKHTGMHQIDISTTDEFIIQGVRKQYVLLKQ
jgi:hypothetical protein